MRRRIGDTREIVTIVILALVAACADTGSSTDETTGASSTSTSTGPDTSTTTSPGTSSTDASSTDGSDTGASSTDGTDSTGPGLIPCTVSTMSSDLPGVSIEITAPTCTFTVDEAQAGVAIDYEVVVEQDVAGVYPDEFGSANCTTLVDLMLLVSERLLGDGINYCVCDKGLCPPWDPPEVTVTAGTYPLTFMWEGHAWNGPSDTPTPFGDPFPPGTHTLELKAIGQFDDPGMGLRNFEVLTEAEVVLTP